MPPPSRNKIVPAKKTKKSSKPSETRNKPRQEEPTQSIPLELQQLLLNIFKNSFSERLESNIQPLLQEVKGHLFNRDFATAFGRNDYLEAYAARWSPPRALGYVQALVDLKEPIMSTLADSNGKIVCLGGGAGAEMVAIAGFINLLNRTENSDEKPKPLEVCAIDVSDWTTVVEKLSQSVKTTPPSSKYASAAAQASNTPLIDHGTLSVTFHQQDVLTADLTVLTPLLHDACLITLLFTLNELYSTSLSATQRFLMNLTACLKEGALLLVIDSPGSYSSVMLNGAEKKYPMQWLLDHTLLQQGSKGEPAPWTKLTEDESRWFRLDAGLTYPIDLENMRFQLHLYRRDA
jgi:25S rRNA (uracil2843-N3)-methyltransferase